MDGPAASSQEWSSWPDWFADAVVLAQQTSDVLEQIQSEWGELSRREEPWTTDTIMNEVVNSWERFTPVLGEVIQHWVEGGSEALRRTWPEAGADLAAWSSQLDGTPVGGTVSRYAEVGRDVADRMVRGDYQSADAVNTWAVLGGMWAQDAWRLVADARRGPGAPEHGGSHGADESGTTEP